jgi:Zn-dependent protease
MYPIGGVARLAHLPRDPKQELLIAIAGPAVNVALGVFFMIIAGGTRSLESLTIISSSAIPSLLVYVNFAMAAFNMIPAFPMDGGRVLRAGLASKMSFERATQIAGFVGMAMGVVFAIVGLVGVNVVLVFIGAFVFFGARHEVRQVVGTV